MTGLQMQLLMSLHMHSQTNKQQTKPRNALSLEFFCFCVYGFFFNKKKKTIQTQNKLAFPISDSILEIYVSVCFSLTFYETCVETGTEIWISSLIS
jgi:hypothetical protein